MAILKRTGSVLATVLAVAALGSMFQPTTSGTSLVLETEVTASATDSGKSRSAGNAAANPVPPRDQVALRSNGALGDEESFGSLAGDGELIDGDCLVEEAPPCVDDLVEMTRNGERSPHRGQRDHQQRGRQQRDQQLRDHQ